MNSQPGYKPGGRVHPGTPNPHQYVRALAWFGLLLTATGLLSGCARIKQYSLDSWQGPIPMHDLRYVQGDP